MTLDEMFKQYVEQVVKSYLSEHANIIVKDETLDVYLDTYLNEHDYMTRDDVNEQISGATVYVEASLSA